MQNYDHKEIEKKWQAVWEAAGMYRAADDSDKKKYYCLIEFPYPSGEGLHVGHIRSNTAMDIIARKRRAEGYNVLYPIGWDAFGLPTENYAIKTKTHPAIVTKQNTDNFRRQLMSLGFSFDWDREVNTTDPAYYKWTQWIFLQMFKKSLAYKAKMSINWCLSCKIGLANEEVIDGACERCDGPTEKREKEQWMLAITKYADRLDKDLDDVDYLEKIKIQQRNWIGRSEGAEIDFTIANTDKQFIVFTTRPDTLFGATYCVLAPDHVLVDEIKDQIENWSDVVTYRKEVKNKTDMERTAEGKEKTGVMLNGVKAVNPANGEKIPIFIADYVLAQYGTGAIMAVPAHDERDHQFAKKMSLSIVGVIAPANATRERLPELKKLYEETEILQDAPILNHGFLLNSRQFDGIFSEEAKKKITEFVGGRMKTTYKLRDWVFSRQRYWGEPIPLVHCKKCGIVPVPESDLPVVLPDVTSYMPTDTGESPLALIFEWVNTKCPQCGGPAKRETDTMPQWAGSSWYYLRYIDPRNDKVFADKKKLTYWTPVDWYNGGMEHTTLHLLYSRFWHKFLYDIGVVPTHEPYQKRTAQGMILSEGGVKMSKSKGNVVNPDGIVEKYGADTLRLYEMFMGPFDQSVAWSTGSIIGVHRFLERAWRLKEKVGKADDESGAEAVLHKTIKKVSDDIEAFGFNTAISAMMIFVNELGKFEAISRRTYEIFLKFLAPFAPHITEELWHEMGNTSSIHSTSWPVFDPAKIVEKEATIVIQVGGKVRDTMTVTRDFGENAALAAALARPLVAKWTEGKKVLKIIYIPHRLLNILIGEG